MSEKKEPYAFGSTKVEPPKTTSGPKPTMQELFLAAQAADAELQRLKVAFDLASEQLQQALAASRQAWKTLKKHPDLASVEWEA